MNFGEDVDGSDTTEKTTEKSDYTAEKILDAIREDPFITTKGLVSKFNLTEDGIYYNIKKLRSSNRIQRVGGRKSGYWVILK